MFPVQVVHHVLRELHASKKQPFIEQKAALYIKPRDPHSPDDVII